MDGGQKLCAQISTQEEGSKSKESPIDYEILSKRNKGRGIRRGPRKCKDGWGKSQLGLSSRREGKIFECQRAKERRKNPSERESDTK